MHEISLVRTVFRTLEETFTAEELTKVESIQLKIGPLANVEPVFLQNAFEAVLQEEQTSYRGAKLLVNMLPVLIECSQCGQITEIQNYRFVCQCGKPCANVIQGNELLIEKVVFRDA